MPSLTVPKPKALIMDMSGTAVKAGFIDKVLIPYIRDNIKEYLNENWNQKIVKKDIEKMRKESETQEQKIAAADADEAQQKQSVEDYVLGALDAKRESKGLSMFRFHMWFDGYKKDKIKTPVYSDVAIQVKKWRDMDIKIYVLSNGWAEATKKMLGKTDKGDMNLMIEQHFDSSEGDLTEKETYVKLIAKIGINAEETLFLTKSGAEGRAAKEAGLAVILVMTHRKEIEKLNEEEKEMPKIRSFNELEFSSKE